MRESASASSVDAAPCLVPEPTSSLSKHAYTVTAFALPRAMNACSEV